MTTLDQADETALATFEAKYTKTTNGITCNRRDCGTELKDTHPGLVIHVGVIPQTPVVCDGCGFEGYRIVP